MISLSLKILTAKEGHFLAKEKDPFYSLSQNQRMVRVGRELEDYPAPTEIRHAIMSPNLKGN